jgi:hypothetical protein
MEPSNTPKGQDTTNNDAQRSENSSQAGTRSTSAQANTKSDHRNEHPYYHQPNPRWWHRIDWSQVILDLLLLIVGIKLACIYTGQLNQMVEQNRSNREFFQKDQRPYIWVSAVVGIVPQQKKQLLARVYLANYGKSPAMEERNVGKIFHGKDAITQADKWFDEMDSGHLSTKDTSVTIVPQGIPADGEKSPVWSSIGSDAPLSGPEAKYITENSFSEILAVHVEYTDIGGKSFYFSDICYHRTTTGNMGICHRHNEMK